MADVEGYLLSKGIDLHPAPKMNVRTACFFCDELENGGEAKTGRLYIKVDPDDEIPGMFWCHLCNAKGTLNKIKRHFGDDPDVNFMDKSRKLQVFEAAADYYHDMLDQATIDYLMQERGLSWETIQEKKFGRATGDLTDHLMQKGFNVHDIQAAGLAWDSGKDFFKEDVITIPYYDQGICSQIRGRDLSTKKNKYKTPQDQDAMLYNLDVLTEGPTEVILTEGEFDSDILNEYGYHSVGAPGSNSFQEEWVDYFKDVRKVYIAFDPDEPGERGAERIAGFFGPKARVIKLPEHEPGKPKVDVTEFFIGLGRVKEDFDALLRRASSGLLVSVRDAYEKWLDREGNPDLKGLELGIRKIDVPLKPGLLPGQVMTVLARTGTGKSLLMMNMMHRMIKMRPDVKILFMTLEQTSNEWFERARRIYGFYNPDIDLIDLDELTLQNYERNMYMVEKNKVSMEEMEASIYHASDELGGDLDLVIVDYLGYWARAFKGEGYERTTAAIMALKEIAKKADVPIIAPHQVNRGSKPGQPIVLSDARESGAVEETSDFTLSILNPDNDPGRDAMDKDGIVRLSILKSRHGGVGLEAELQIAPVSLAWVPQIDSVYDLDFYLKAEKEYRWKQNYSAFDYNNIFETHKTGDVSVIQRREDHEVDI